MTKPECNFPLNNSAQPLILVVCRLSAPFIIEFSVKSVPSHSALTGTEGLGVFLN